MYTFAHRLRPPPSSLPPAGLVKDAGHLTAADCLGMGADGGPAPVEGGATATTYREQCAGARPDPAAGTAVAQGAAGARRPGQNSSGVESCLKPGPATPLEQQLQQLREAGSHRNKLEPLGRPRQHGTALPPGLGTEQAFGLAVHARELERANQGKKVIYGCGDGAAAAEGGNSSVHAAHELYVRSHADFSPGEQRKYGYDWKGVDPAALRFGRPPAADAAGEIKAVLQPGQPADSIDALPEKMQRFALKHRDALSLPRSPGAVERNLPAGHTYGKPPTPASWGADRILRGGYSPAEQQPDPGLGKLAAGGGPRQGRALVREDSAQQARQQAGQAGCGKEACSAAQPGLAGFAVRNNAAASPSLPLAGAAAMGGGGAARQGGRAPHGGAGELLRPIDRVCRGVTEEHFRQPRSRQELWEVAAASGVVADQPSFQAIYDKACRASGGYGCVSLEGFIKTKTEMVKAELLKRR